EAVRLRPDSYDAQSLLGLVLLQEGQDDEAIPALQKAVDLWPGDSRLLGLLGSKYLERHSYQQASVLLRQAVDLQPEVPQLRYLLIQAYRGLGRQEDAARETEILARGQSAKRAEPQ